MDDNSTEEATNIDEKVKAIELLLNSAEIEQFQNVSIFLKAKFLARPFVCLYVCSLNISALGYWFY